MARVTATARHTYGRFVREHVLNFDVELSEFIDGSAFLQLLRGAIHDLCTLTGASREEISITIPFAVWVSVRADLAYLIAASPDAFGADDLSDYLGIRRIAIDAPGTDELDT